MKSGTAAVVFRVGGLLGVYPQNQALGVEFSALIGQRNTLPVGTSGVSGVFGSPVSPLSCTHFLCPCPEPL